ncbi:uncharacterized protein TNCV_4464761 [Trichonephila clavipes]|nr:uncharacterized protein TNCV_4464761 [Trichonephila clavipes]
MAPDVEWASEKVDDEPLSTRFVRWRHNQLLLTLLTIAALLVAVAVISGTVLYFQFAFSKRSSSPLLIEDEIFNDSDIINTLMNFEDGQEARYFEEWIKIFRDPAFEQIGKAFS